MKTATDLLAEMLAIYEDPEKGIAGLGLWLHHEKEEVRAVVEREVDEVGRLKKLAHRVHTYCEDSWYSCPKAEDGCCDEHAGDDCNCGADEHNAEVEATIDRARGEGE